MDYWRSVLLLALATRGHAAIAADKFDIKSHYTKQEFRIPMRDGVRLFTIVYAPKDATNKYPILITRTPYGVAPYEPDAYPEHLGPSTKFAQDGFIFVYQDARGRFMSEGDFVEMTPEGGPGTNESTDTYDTIDWLVKNIGGNNGKVGLVGTSYPGFYTSAGLINAHPALLAASPEAPISDLYMGDDSYHNGAFFLLANFGFYTVFGKQHNPEPAPGHDDMHFDYGTQDGYQFFLKMGPLANSNNKYFKDRNPYWTDVMEHTKYDEFWKTRDLLPHLKNIKPAVLVVGGWFDAEDLAGTLNTFRAIDGQSPETPNKLVMGPWVHGGWLGRKGDQLGDITWGKETSPFFLDEILLPFFRHYLKDAPDADLPKAYVFETGKNVWRKKDQWPPADAKLQRFYLQAHGELSRHTPEKAESKFDQYTSDPSNPVPFFNRPTLDMSPEYMDADQRFAHARSDVLTYETTPLTEDLAAAGPVSPSLFVSTAGSDADFVVKLIDVYPADAGKLSGYEQLVRGEPFRGKFRNSFEHPEPFRPGEIEDIHFTMPDIYHCFQKGHRIMLQIQSSWFPLVDRNPQTFTDIPNAKPSDFVPRQERIYRSPNAASSIELNVEP